MFVKPWCKPVLYTCTVQVYCYIFVRPWVVKNRLYKLFMPMKWFHVSPIFRCQARSGRTRGQRMRARMTSARPEAGPRASPRGCSPTSDPQLARGNSRVQGSNQGEILVFSVFFWSTYKWKWTCCPHIWHHGSHQWAHPMDGVVYNNHCQIV